LLIGTGEYDVCECTGVGSDEDEEGVEAVAVLAEETAEVETVEGAAAGTDADAAGCTAADAACALCGHVEFEHECEWPLCAGAAVPPWLCA
jgi:hypothetical protein